MIILVYAASEEVVGAMLVGLGGAKRAGESHDEGSLCDTDGLLQHAAFLVYPFTRLLAATIGINSYLILNGAIAGFTFVVVVAAAG